MYYCYTLVESLKLALLAYLVVVPFLLCLDVKLMTSFAATYMLSPSFFRSTMILGEYSCQEKSKKIDVVARFLFPQNYECIYIHVRKFMKIRHQVIVRYRGTQSNPTPCNLGRNIL